MGVMVTKVSEKVVQVMKQKFEEGYEKKVSDIEKEWDRMHGVEGAKIVANYEIQISELENERARLEARLKELEADRGAH